MNRRTVTLAAGDALRHLLRRAAAAGSLAIVRQSHAAAVVAGRLCPLLIAALISAYSHLRLPALSLLVFQHWKYLRRSPEISVHNALLAALARCSLFTETLTAFREMMRHHLPDEFTVSIAAKAAAELQDCRFGAVVHSLVRRLGLELDCVVSNSLMLMYFRSGFCGEGRQVFDEMPVRGVSSWNALISSGVVSGESVDEWEVCRLVRGMQLEGLRPDSFTISTVLPRCSVRIGKAMHCYAIRNGLGSSFDFHIGACLIDMYLKANRVDVARRVFDAMPSRNVVAWTQMIAGYVDISGYEEALSVFREMQLWERIVPNKITLVSTLPAVASLAKLMEGKQIHGFAVRLELNREVSLNNALIDMYSKCGNLEYARKIFDGTLWQKDDISWCTMISGYGINGKGRDAITLFEKMCSLGYKFDHMTGLAVLSACRRAGLTVEGIYIYESLVKDHEVSSSMEMCSCVVDMLGQAGKLNLALNFIVSMEMEPSPSIWGSLLDASVIHNDKDMQNLASSFLLKLEPNNASNYVSLSNLYASCGRWDLVEHIRRLISQGRLRKMHGYSSVDMNNVIQPI